MPEPGHINSIWSNRLNLQPVAKKKDSDDNHGVWRNSHIIRFSQIDGAGIVYYPRYFEMLADSFPQQFTVQRPTQFDISFHHPVRLGERLLLEPKSGEVPRGTSVSENEFAVVDRELSVDGKSAGELCFKLHKTHLNSTTSADWSTDPHSFVRQVEIRDWMTGANGRMHLSRCYELTAVLMEEWFTESLKCPFATMQSSDGALVPTVKLQTEVQELPCQGDILQLSLVVLHIGRSSLGLGMTVSRNGQLLVKIRQTVVFVSYRNDQLSSEQIPSHLLPSLNNQLVVAAG